MSSGISSSTARRIVSGSTLPAATVGRAFIKTGADEGLHVCSSVGVWTGPLGAGGGGAAWGAITGTLADQTDLQTALDAKQDDITFGTGVLTALGVNVGSAGAPVVNGGALGTPSSGTVTNLTGTASININGTVGATTPATGAFTTGSFSGNILASGLIQFSGTGATFPALKRSTTELQARLADDSDYAPFRAKRLGAENIFLQTSGIIGSTLAALAGDFDTYRNVVTNILHFATNETNGRVASLSASSADVVESNNGAIGSFRDFKARKYLVDQTITAGGTTGDQVINKAAGTVNIAAAGTSVTVTSSQCTTSSIVFAVIRTNDSTATIKNVVPSAGSFVINLGAAANAEISIGWEIRN